MKYANIFAEAETAIVREQWLRKGLDITEEDLDKANRLVQIALDSGYPSRFLTAFENMARKPIFLPCTCWWCKLKRKFQCFKRRHS